MVENYQSQSSDSFNHTLIAPLAKLKKKIANLQITRKIIKFNYFVEASY
jgi:hypothetical protein